LEFFFPPNQIGYVLDLSVLFEDGSVCNNALADFGEPVGLALPPSALSSSESANSIVENNPNNQSPLPTKRPRTYNTKGFKRRTQKLTSHRDRRPGGDKKRTHFDHHQYRAAQANQAPAQATTAIIPPCSNRGHSPTKSQVKQMCEHGDGEESELDYGTDSSESDSD
jgi:hypothetical protein